MTLRPRHLGVCAAVALALASAGLLAVGQQAKPLAPTASQGPRDATPAQPAGTGVIAGTLVSANTGRPVRRAHVAVSGLDPHFSKTATTDDTGRFSLTDLPAGIFELTASKPGYLDVSFGQKQPGDGRAGTPIQLAVGQHLDDVKLAIPKGGVLTGTVLDEQGEPSFGTQVRALRYVLRGGERVLQAAGSATTDDRGIYRIPSLLPGDYIVNATPPNDDGLDARLKMQQVEQAAMSRGASGAEQEAAMADAKMAMARAMNGSDAPDPTTAYAPVYYPGTTTASGAATVSLGPSEERSGIDVPLQLVPVARVNGTVTGVDGQPAGGVQIQLVDLSQLLPGVGTRTTSSGPDGRFSFAAVPPGQYTVMARSASRDAAKMMLDIGKGGPAPASKEAAVAAMNSQTTVAWATSDAAVDGRAPLNLSLLLRPGMTFSGRFVSEAAGAPPDYTRTRLSLIAVSPGIDSAQAVPIDASGAFNAAGLAPGRYRVSAVGLPSPLKLASMMVAGRDALDFPLEIKPGEDVGGAVATLSDRSTSIAGTLQDSGNQPALGYTVIVFAADSRFWTPQSRRIQAARPSTSGGFTFHDLPPGDYLMAAVTDVEPGQWLDPAFLRPLAAGAASVKLAQGERTTQTIKVR